MSKLGQEPAFPAFEHNESGYGNQLTLYFGGERQYIPFTKGVNKRFYAACAAMQGLLSAPHSTKEKSIELIVYESYLCADKLLKQENEK